MEILLEIASFAAKGMVVFSVIAAVALVIAGLSRRRPSSAGHLEIRRINDEQKHMAEDLRHATLEPKAFKRDAKQRKKDDKHKKPADKKIYVLDFKGDLLASAVEHLRQEITALLGVIKEGDEVIVRLESPGGVVHGYGLAASQLVRLRQRNIPLTVCIDKVAASGGYMMAAVADHIVAAPFAIVGSIGVVAQIPNVHKLLKEHGVDYEEMTAGEYKRTVSVFGEITRKGREKFQEQLEETHVLFKKFINDYRPTLDIGAVATGEYWHGSRALELGLVNDLMTSDDYLLAQLDSAELFEVKYKRPKAWRERLSHNAEASLSRMLLRVFSAAQWLRFS